jgi:hypothetical protein
MPIGSFCLLLALPHVSVWRQRREKREGGSWDTQKRRRRRRSRRSNNGGDQEKRKGRVKLRKPTPPLEC